MGKGDPVPISPSSLIPVGGRNFSSMQSVNDLRSLQAAGIGHGSLDPTAGVMKDDQIPRTVSVQAPEKQTKTFTRGQSVYDKRRGHNGVIIKAAAGHTKKTRTPVHEIADSKGNAWLAKQSDLELS